MEIPPATASSPSPTPPMDWRRAASGRPEWVFPQPSPDEVADLESRFPDIVQVPIDQLEEEMTRWELTGVVGRSFGRWVSPAAVAAEFRRSGAAGEIDHFGLPNGYYIFRFSDASARDQVLRRPWVVAGQVIGLEAWRPQFLPTDEAIFSALVWIRLPNLPIEFWNESTLRLIASTAGEFCFPDEFTTERRRIGFARICVKVDFRQALKPGTRIRGKFLPFWQQIGYENLGQICSSCGSLHLSKAQSGCSTDRAKPVSQVADPGAKYGPWMAAVRRRPPPAATPKVSQPIGGEWTSPTRVARRKPQFGQVVVDSSSGGSRSSPANTKGGAVAASDRSQVFTETSNLVLGASSKRAGLPKQAAGRAGSSKDLAELNPFAVLHPDYMNDKPKSSSDPNPGPVKRARPHDTLTSRIVSRPNSTIPLNRQKMGDKGKQQISQDMITFTAKAAKVPTDLKLPSPKAPLPVSDAQMDLDSTSTTHGLTQSCDHDTAVLLLRQSICKPGVVDPPTLRAEAVGHDHSVTDDDLIIEADDTVDDFQGGGTPLQDEVMGGEQQEEAPPHYLAQ